MNDQASTSEAAIRRTVYCLLIITSAGAMTGRIWSVKSERGQTPLLCANDRSRWCTIRALVDHGTYALDNVMYNRSGGRHPEWYTIDLVRHRGRDGREHFYSSKPPLLPTLLAPQYWLVKRTTGATLAESSFYVVRLLLLVNNVLPLVLYFVLLAQLVERLGVTTWGRLFVLGAATWGTFLSTFAVTLNNHLPAAISVLVAVFAAERIFRRDDCSPGYYALAGVAAAFAAANELPALSFFALIALVLLLRSPRKTLLAFIPAASLVLIAFFATNYAAHGTWRPAYTHRKDGPVVATLPIAPRAMDDPVALPELLAAVNSAGVTVSYQATIQPSARAGRWVLYDPAQDKRWAVVANGEVMAIHSWGNWYEYEGSYWAPGMLRGVDRGESSRAVYAMNVLVGHHGVFSLTPLWILSAVGAVMWLRSGDRRLRGFAALVVLLTVVVLAFYIARPLVDRNYGGVSCGFRWAFWCIPLWLLCLVPAADALSRRPLGRWVAWACLLVSVASASYTNLDPWSHPWIFDYWTYIQWISY